LTEEVHSRPVIEEGGGGCQGPAPVNELEAGPRPCQKIGKNISMKMEPGSCFTPLKNIM